MCFLGEFCNRVLHVHLPGSIIGMILLFICLLTGIIKLSMIEEITKFLLDHLAFFLSRQGLDYWRIPVF